MSRTMTCTCGETVEAADLETLIQPILDHFSKNHPELGLTAVSVRNYLEAEDRTAHVSTERLEEIGPVEVVPISADRTGDILYFFDYDAFPDNPAWASCYCVAYFPEGRGGPPWQNMRAALVERLKNGGVTGTLAYEGGKVVGWCNATARSEVPAFRDGDDEGVCSLVCFAIAPTHRGHGLREKLLDAATEQARQEGFDVLEGYPKTGTVDADRAYRGTSDTYERAGFTRTNQDPLTYRLEL